MCSMVIPRAKRRGGEQYRSIPSPLTLVYFDHPLVRRPHPTPQMISDTFDFRSGDERFAVRRSTIHGRGLFAVMPLPARRKLGELAGTIIPLRAARRKAKSLETIKIVEFDDGWALDATTDSNCFQYVNHSCSPNTYVRLFRHRVEFYTLRPIARGEELTCDYGLTQHEGTHRCRCGAAQCSGTL